MFNWIINLFHKEKEKCDHGWVIEDTDKLPIKRTSRGFSVCPDCALKSSLQQLGSGIELSQEDADKLRKIINKEKNEKKI